MPTVPPQGVAARSAGRVPATRILAIAGSLRRDSFNRRLLLAAGNCAPAGVWLDLWDGLAEVPAFDEDGEVGSSSPPVAGLREQIRTADAVLIATPEYNGSVPGALKNALDWASRPFATNALRGKPVAVIGASPSPHGAKRAQDDLRRVLAVIGADVVDVELAVASVHRHFDRHGALTDVTLQNRLQLVLGKLSAHASVPTVRLAG